MHGGPLLFLLVPVVSSTVTVVPSSYFTSATNIALRSTDAQPFASGSLPGYCRETGPGIDQTILGTDHNLNKHCYTNINDGKLGNTYSWIPGPAYGGQHFVGVSFPKPRVATGIRIARDSGTAYGDRFAGTYTVYTTMTDAPSYNRGTWVSQGSFTRPNSAPIYLKFDHLVTTTGIKIVLSDSSGCIDELYVYGSEMCPVDPNAEEPCALNGVTNTFRGLAYWPKLNSDFSSGKILNTIPYTRRDTGTSCPFFQRHNRCPSGSFTSASACEGGNKDTGFSIINLGRTGYFATGNVIKFRGWYPAGSAECFFYENGSVRREAIAKQQCSRSCNVLISLESCVGAFAIRIWGGGSCGSTSYEGGVKVVPSFPRDYPIYYNLMDSGFRSDNNGATTVHNSPISGNHDKLTLSGWTHWKDYARGKIRATSGSATAKIQGLQVRKMYHYHIYQTYLGTSSYTTSHFRAESDPEMKDVQTNRNPYQPNIQGSVWSDSTGCITFTFTMKSGHVVLSFIGLEPDGFPNECRDEQFYQLLAANGNHVPVRCGTKGRLECASTTGTGCWWGRAEYSSYSLYQPVPLGMNDPSGQSPYDEPCPAWRDRNNADACTILGCYNPPPLNYKLLSEFDIQFDFKTEGVKNTNGNVESYVWSQYAGQGGRPERAEMIGWTHTRDYHRGYLKNTNGAARVRVHHLRPNTEYEYAVYQFASIWGGKNRMRVNDQYWFDTEATTCLDKPTATGFATSDNKGEINFHFNRDQNHASITAIGLDPGRFSQGCPSTRPTYHYNFNLRRNENLVDTTTYTLTSREAKLELVGWNYARNYQDGYVDYGGMQGTATVSGLKPNKRYHYHLHNMCTGGYYPPSGWTPCGANQISINGVTNPQWIVGEKCKGYEMLHGVTTSTAEGKIVIKVIRHVSHVALSVIGIDDYYGGFPARQQGCSQLQWEGDFDRLMNNPEDVPENTEGQIQWAGDWYGMQSDANFPKQTKDTFFSYQQFSSMTGKIGEEAAIVEVAVPKIQHWRLTEYHHPLKIQDKTGWLWGLDHGEEVLVGRQTYGAGWWPSNSFSVNAGNPSAENYAILDQLENFRLPNGKLWLKMTWPGTSHSDQIWLQTSNPYSKRTRGVLGYEADSVAYTDNGWGGLQYNGGGKALLSGSAGHSTSWFYAFGSYQDWSGGIPGHRSAVKRVEIYALRPADVPLAPIHHICFSSCDLNDKFGVLEPVLKNGATCSPGEGVHLDGIDDYVELGSVTLGGALSFSAWVKLTDLSGSGSRRIFDFGNSASARVYFGQNSNSKQPSFGVVQGSARTHTASGATDFWVKDTLTHVLATISSDGTTRIYKDGSLISLDDSSKQQLQSVKRTHHYLGKCLASASSSLVKGNIYAFSIYGRELTPSEVKKVYTQGTIDRCFHIENNPNGKQKDFPYLSTVPSIKIKPVRAYTPVNENQISNWLVGSAASRKSSVAHDTDALWKFLACSGKILKDTPDSSTELKQLVHCASPFSYAGGSGWSRTISYSFTASDCGGSNNIASTCLIGLKDTRHVGQDEDWRAFTGNPAKIQWWLGSGQTNPSDHNSNRPRGNVAADYLCPATNTRLSSDFTRYRCHTSNNYAGQTGLRKHTFTAAECGGALPPKSGEGCLAVFGRRQQYGGDRHWEILRKEQSTTIQWQCNGCTGGMNAEVHYLCPNLKDWRNSPWKIYNCYAHLYNPSVYTAKGAVGYTHMYHWRIEDCGGLPAANAKCFAGHRGGLFLGNRNEDYQVLSPNDGKDEWFCVARKSKNEVVGPFSNIEHAKNELNKQTGGSSNAQMVCEMTQNGPKSSASTVGGQSQTAPAFKSWWSGTSDIASMNLMCQNDAKCRRGPTNSTGFGMRWYCNDCTGAARVSADYVCYEDSIPATCQEYMNTGYTESGVYKISLGGFIGYFWCDMTHPGEAWMRMQYMESNYDQHKAEVTGQVVPKSFLIALHAKVTAWGWSNSKAGMLSSGKTWILRGNTLDAKGYNVGTTNSGGYYWAEYTLDKYEAWYNVANGGTPTSMTGTFQSYEGGRLQYTGTVDTYEAWTSFYVGCGWTQHYARGQRKTLHTGGQRSHCCEYVHGGCNGYRYNYQNSVTARKPYGGTPRYVWVATADG